MKIFISHSSLDADMAKALSAFLESIDCSINVFCSSQKGSIKVGVDFVKEITKELDECNIFIPLLTKNYYESYFAMIELGFAYSVLCRQSTDREMDYIYPLAVLPIKKAEALVSTPLARLQVCSINDEGDIHSYCQSICEKSNIVSSPGLNKQITSFIYDINKIIYSSFNIIAGSKILVCKSDNVPGEDRDYLECSEDMGINCYTINFKAKPFENSTTYPDFLSIVFQYIDKVNLYDIINIYEGSKLSLQIDNYTNSISKIDIEIKSSDNNRILHKQTTALGDGINNILIPLKELKFEALRQISEICFVLKPSAYIENEGMFQIKDFKVTHDK